MPYGHNYHLLFTYIHLQLYRDWNVAIMREKTQGPYTSEHSISDGPGPTEITCSDVYGPSEIDCSNASGRSEFDCSDTSSTCVATLMLTHLSNNTVIFEKIKLKS